MDIAAGLLVFAATFALVRLPFAPSADSRLIRQQLTRERSHEEPTGEADGLDVGFRERFMQPMVKSLGATLVRLTPKAQLDRLSQKLSAAGDPLTTAQYFILRLGLTLTGLLPVVLGGRFILLGLCAAYLGYRLPNAWLDRLEKNRKKLFAKLLPDALDLLSVSVEAGMGFDQALARLAERSRSPVREEFIRVLSEMRFGRSRTDALEDLAGRMDIPELRQFVASVVQAESLGVSLSRPLRVQADALRVKRRQKAEEAALKTPIKLLFPLVFLIFPALFVVLLGPAILSFGQLFHP